MLKARRHQLGRWWWLIVTAGALGLAVASPARAASGAGDDWLACKSVYESVASRSPIPSPGRPPAETYLTDDSRMHACTRIFSHPLLSRKDRVTAYINRGIEYGFKFDWDHEIADETKAIEIAPYVLVAAYGYRGWAYGNKGDYDKAIADFDKVIQNYPEVAEAYVNRGWAYGNKGDWDHAIADYDMAIQIGDRQKNAYGDVFYYRGVAYSQKGDAAKALVDFREAVRLSGTWKVPDGTPWSTDAVKRIAELEAKPASPPPSPSPVAVPPPPSDAPTRIVRVPDQPAVSTGAKFTVKAATQDGKEPNFIYVEGALAAGDDKRFASLAVVVTDPVVVLNSPGGDLVAGINIGNAIHVLRFRTAVLQGFSCASACALAWLGGSPRFMGEGATVGFHAAYATENGAVSSVGNAMVGAYLNGLGLPLSAVTYMTTKQPSDIQWLTFDDAAKIGIEVSRLPQ